MNYSDVKEAFAALLDNVDQCKSAGMSEANRRTLKSKLNQKDSKVTGDTMRGWLYAAGWVEKSEWQEPNKKASE